MADPHEAWTDELRRDLDAAMFRTGSLADPLVQSARAAFDIWWAAKHVPAYLPVESLGAVTAPAALPRLESAGRADLQDRVERLALENHILQEKLEKRLSQCREEHEARLARLDVANRRLETEVERLKAVAEAKTRLQERHQALERDLALERERSAMAEQALMVERERTAENEARIAKLREELAAQGGTLEELRRRSGDSWERLIQAKESTDSDVALLREEMAFFIEELKIIRNTLRDAR